MYSNTLGDSCMNDLAKAASEGALSQLKLLCLQNAPRVTKKGRDAVRQAVAFSASPRGKGVATLRVFN